MCVCVGVCDTRLVACSFFLITQSYGIKWRPVDRQRALCPRPRLAKWQTLKPHTHTHTYRYMYTAIDWDTGRWTTKREK